MARVLPLALALALVGPITGPAGQSGNAPDGLLLAVLPCSNIETTFKKFYPLLSYLKAETGIPVTITVPTELSEFESLIKNGSVDFALQDPHTYRQVSKDFDGATLLQTVALNGTTAQSGVLIVRRERGLRSLADLRGKTVMFGPRTSTPKWVAARMLFEAGGVSVDRHLRAVNGGCCEDIAFEVFVRTVDAGVICDHFLAQHEARQKELGVDPASLDVIGRTPAFPTRVFAARRGVPAERAGAVIAALLRLDANLPAHAAVLKSAEIRGFVRATEQAYLAEVARATPAGQR